MENKIKNLVITIGFVLILIITFFTNILSKDNLISNTERRKLQQFPNFTLDTITSSKAMDEFEKYTTDQFVLRDSFRNIKSWFNVNIYNQKDNNGLFEKDGALYKMEYPLKENNVNKSLNKIASIYNNYLKGMSVYYTIIPDKNYYLENDDHLKLDYTRLQKMAKTTLHDLKYIDIFDTLSLEDYYKTDLHWKQENLNFVVNKIQKEMDLVNTENTNYTKNTIGKFYGTYYGQLTTNVEPDTMYTLTNDTLLNCKVYNYEKEKYVDIYSSPNTSDLYDTYLSGATSLIRIDNPNSKTDKELLLFRDSFGSSIAPLLVENYSSITLIDLRYIPSNLLTKYTEFNNQDVLFMYSTLILNQNVLR